jgi:hypothetical protein
VNVQADADALYEAGRAPGPASTMEVESRSPSVTHTVSMRKAQDRLNGGARSPRERLLKERLKGLLA